MASDDENIVNLASFRKKQRQAGKQSEKRSQELQAAANRVKFGRKGADKKIARIDALRRKNALENKRLEPLGPSGAKRPRDTPSDSKAPPQDDEGA
ncbi:MAG: DUF4169 family protein [Parvibaculum sp.]